jgi:hypothetical protein
MKRVLVRYKVKPDRAAENRQYIEKVFEDNRTESVTPRSRSTTASASYISPRSRLPAGIP